MGRPKNFDNDPSHYQVKATQDIQPNRFDVSYGATQVVEATIRKELGDADITVSVVGQNGNVTVPMTAAPAGERYGEVKGYYFERRQATFPGVIGTRAVQAGDIVNVVVKAGGLQQEFRYRIAGAAAGPGQEARARRRRRGLQGQVPERHRRLRHRAALPGAAQGRARGRGLRGRDLRHRRPAGQRRHAEPGPARADQVPDQPRRDGALRRRQLLLGRRLRPAGRHDHRPAPPDLGHGADRQLRDGVRGRTRSCSSCASTPTTAASCSSTAATCTRRSPPPAPA